MSEQKGRYAAELSSPTSGSAGGGVLSLENPEGVALIVDRLILDILTPAENAITVDAGIATSGSTSSDTLIDGASVASAALLDNIENKGDNGKSRQTWGASQYLTISASGSAGEMEGNAYIDYFRK